VAIDHYSIWVETKVIAECGAKIHARFLEDEILCQFSVPSML
jgi:hypothetical protein